MTDSPIDSPPDPAPVGDAGSDATKQDAIRGATLLSVRQILVGVVTVAGIIGLPLLLDPSEFALYGYVNTVILVGAGIGDLGLGASIIRGQASPGVLARSLALQLTFWGLVSVALVVGAIVANPFGFTVITSVLLILSLFFFSLQALPTALLEKEMRFGKISAIEVAQRLILFSLAMGLAIFHPAEWSIPIAALAAAVIGYPAFMYAARWKWPPRWTSGTTAFKGFASEWWQVRIASQMAYATYPLLGGIIFSSRDVGLIVWALAITSIPAYLAPMVARAAFPALTRARPADRPGIYSPLLRGLFLFGGPLIAGLLVSAGPLTSDIFGPQWVDAVPLLRLESVTSALGIATSSAIPFIFLSVPPRQVKWICVCTTCLVVVGGLALAPLLGYLSISVATIVAFSGQVLVFNRLLQRELGYSLIRDMLPAVTGIIVGTAAGLPIVLAYDSLPVAIAAGILAAGIQVGVTFALRGGVNPRSVLAAMRNRSSADFTAA